MKALLTAIAICAAAFVSAGATPAAEADHSRQGFVGKLDRR
jgi:hypothetical protein